MKTAITPTRAENYSEWFQQIIVAADLAENSPTRGCMTIKPYGWAIWELMRDDMDKRIKAMGVQNANFPMLIPIEFFNKEAQHVAGFAKECAVVTHHRLKIIDGVLKPDPDAKLTEPYIIRPTSETIIGDAMARWIGSHRDLPLQLNQWVSVLRWEMRPRMFLRTSEFNWQEGHSAFVSREEAQNDVMTALKMYADFTREMLAIESITGEKTAEERFAGADETYTIEQIMQDGKGLQAGTSHNLGQHFAKSFDIKYQGKDGELHHVWTTSWGVSTRLMGSVLMAHGDDDGIKLPPKIAPYQIVIIPILSEQNEYAHNLATKLRERNIRVLVDDSDLRSSDRVWKWIKRGAPLRIEIGAKETDQGTATITRRDIGRDSKQTLKVGEIIENAEKILNEIQSDMLESNIKMNKSFIHNVDSLMEMDAALSSGTRGFFRIEYTKTLTPEFEDVVAKHKVSRRCLDSNDATYVFVAKGY